VSSNSQYLPSKSRQRLPPRPKTVYPSLGINYEIVGVLPEEFGVPESSWEDGEGVARFVDFDKVGHLSLSEEEKCGFMLGQPEQGEVAFLELRNRHSEPDHNFTIDARDIYAVEEMLARDNCGGFIEGIWHSHPPRPVRRGPVNESEEGSGPRPSSFDLDYAPIGWRLFIVHLGDMREFNVDGKEIGRWASRWSQWED